MWYVFFALVWTLVVAFWAQAGFADELLGVIARNMPMHWDYRPLHLGLALWAGKVALVWLVPILGVCSLRLLLPKQAQRGG